MNSASVPLDTSQVKWGVCPENGRHLPLQHNGSKQCYFQQTLKMKTLPEQHQQLEAIENTYTIFPPFSLP